MRNLSYVLLCQLAWPALAGSLQAQEIHTWGPVERTVRYGFRIMNPEEEAATDVEVWVPLPLESPRQEIHYLHYPARDLESTFTDQHGQRLLHYSIDRLEPGEWVELGFVAGITLRNLRWEVPEELPRREELVLTPEERERHLQPEANYSMDSAGMIQLAGELTQGATSDYEKLIRIHDHVTAKIRYVRDGKWDPAVVVLDRGSGSCSEYNYVLSGLCRLAGLPTRCVGGSTNGFRLLPTTDDVFHRWTEVFLEDLGWFPADCSRDANPIRGRRSHFGANYVDVLVWCRQAGGEDDTLGWDYRAKARVRGEHPGIRHDHRTRWFELHPEEEVNAAYAWLAGEGDAVPGPDLLECALLRWDKATVENRVKLVRALAAAERNVAIRWAASLPEAEGLRETIVGELCVPGDLAESVLERCGDLGRLRSWFRSNEKTLTWTEDGRLLQMLKAAGDSTPVVTSEPVEQLWAELGERVVARYRDTLDRDWERKVLVAPLVDQTLAGLGEAFPSLQATLAERIGALPVCELVDGAAFERFMEERGPGRGEYWALANANDTLRAAAAKEASTPDVILLPLCITDRTDSENGAALYHFELKVLELASLRYRSVRASARREAAAAETQDS